MKKEKSITDDITPSSASTPTSFPEQALRKQAEKVARGKVAQPVENPDSLSPEEIKRVFHELRVHQIELEMQNEELRRAQAEIQNARERYFDLYNLAPVGYLTLNNEGLIQEANLTAATLLDVTPNDMVKQPITSFIFNEDQDIYYLHCRQLFKNHKKKSNQSEQPMTCELRMAKRDNTTFWAHLEGTLSQSANGDAICKLILSDISSRKQAEEEHEKLQEQLNQAQKMESVGLLAGGMAHDYNNMLSVIIGYTELAMQKIHIGQPLRPYLEQILKAARRSAAITRQLLTYARKQAISPVLLDLNQTVESMLEMLRRLIGENINLIWIPEEGYCLVRMDPVQIDQILANLCVNARDAIADIGNITIATRTAIFDKSCCPDPVDCAEFVEGKYVLLTVCDNGCGIENKTLDHIFEPFYTTKEIGKGTGLGLSMVYGIVKQNNGFIDVTSEPGKGTTFKIYLPCYEGQTLDAQNKQEAENTLFHNETVLLVEDEPSLLMMGKLMLEKSGYQVLSASTPAVAIQLAERNSNAIRILIADIIMPEMNGRDLAKRLQSLCPNLKVLFMSGYTANVMTDRGLLEDGVNFIQKPFSMKDLIAKLKVMSLQETK